ncbi:MAG: hypothetical protein XD91_0009 [Clostridiales bacterium 38_11]|nr:MAG: hypothetical protein XD91_0009 [Clostridiales bacterium 38_11]HBH13750.1 hypothetical protein [Clostridiales bacterium]
MALLILRKDELEVLSLINGNQINSFSVLNGMDGFDRESFIEKRETHKEVIESFVNDGAIWKDKAGRPYLIRELQGVFNIINSPEKTIRIKAASKKDLVAYYTYVGDMGVIFSIGKNEEFYTVAYTFNRQLLSTWFYDEFIGDLGVDNKSESDINTNWELSGDEFDLLTVMIIFKNHLKQMDGGRQLTLESMGDSDVLSYINENNYFNLNAEHMQKILDKDNLELMLQSLSDKGILKMNDQVIDIHEVLHKGFEKVNLRDIVEISEMTPFMRGKNLYITNLGYMIFEPVMVNPMKWRISILGLKVYPFKLLGELMEFGPVQASELLKKQFKEKL